MKIARSLALAPLLAAPALAQQVGPQAPATPFVAPAPLSGFALANDDDCSTTTDLQLGPGVYSFDTSLATTGAEAQVERAIELGTAAGEAIEVALARCHLGTLARRHGDLDRCTVLYALAEDAILHRLRLRYEALAEGLTTARVLEEMLRDMGATPSSIEREAAEPTTA